MLCFQYFMLIIFPLKGDLIPVWENINLEKFQYGFLPVLGWTAKFKKLLSN